MRILSEYSNTNPLSLHQPTHAPTVRHRTHGMSSKPIPRMMTMKAMRTIHTKHHHPALFVLSLERLVRPLFTRIGRAQPQHTQRTPRHLRRTVRTMKSRCASRGFLLQRCSRFPSTATEGQRSRCTMRRRRCRRRVIHATRLMRSGKQPLCTTPRILPQRKILLAIQTAQRQARLTGLIHTPALARYAE